MPRKPRLHVPGAFYHVTLRGNHRQDIFFSNDDRLLLNGIVAEVIERLAARVHAYCWMTNHIHLLIQVGETPLSRIILRIASRYARAVQKRFHTTGHLFECRYHAVIVDADAYLIALIRYIHMNPIAANMVTKLDDYPWSSHHAYLGIRDEPWVTTDLALSMLSRKRDRAIKKYRRLMGEAVSMDVDELNPNDTRILGSDAFVASIHGRSWRPKSRKTIDQLVTEACDQFTLTREQLLDQRRNRLATHARAWIAYQAATLQIASIASVATLFARDESTLRKSMNRYFDL